VRLQRNALGGLIATDAQAARRSRLGSLERTSARQRHSLGSGRESRPRSHSMTLHPCAAGCGPRHFYVAGGGTKQTIIPARRQAMGRPSGLSRFSTRVWGNLDPDAVDVDLLSFINQVGLNRSAIGN
jgi:hypothetical protein